MGIWGHGLFDSDEASDLCGNAVRFIAEEIDDVFREVQRGNCLGVEVPAGVAILIRLCVEPFNAQYSLDQTLVRHWRNAYLAHLDKWHGNVDPSDDEFRIYRAHVVRAFNRLLKCTEVLDDWRPLEERYEDHAEGVDAPANNQKMRNKRPRTKGPSGTAQATKAKGSRKNSKRR